MYWTCPHCKKEFAKQNQSHNCISISRDVVLADKTPQVVALVKTLTILPWTSSRKVMNSSVPRARHFLHLIFLHNYSILRYGTHFL